MLRRDRPHFATRDVAPSRPNALHIECNMPPRPPPVHRAQAARAIPDGEEGGGGGGGRWVVARSHQQMSPPPNRTSRRRPATAKARHRNAAAPRCKYRPSPRWSVPHWPGASRRGRDGNDFMRDAQRGLQSVPRVAQHVRGHRGPTAMRARRVIVAPCPISSPVIAATTTGRPVEPGALSSVTASAERHPRGRTRSSFLRNGRRNRTSRRR